MISSTASTLPLIGKGLVERAIKARRHRPMFMVDLAVPRDIEPEAGKLDDVFLYTVDDLADVVRTGVEHRQAAVAQAVADYQTWQRAIGRDINPSKLVALVMEAGAKRVTVTAPTYTAVAATKVSALQGEAVISYGGLEDD